MTTKLRQYLQNRGYKTTQSRIMVYSYLTRHDPTTIKSLISATLHRADKASVYRTLGLFKRLGIVQDIIHAGQKMIELTDDFDAHHHHIYCIKCHRSTTIEDKLIESSLNGLAQRSGFELTEHQLELSGICHKCHSQVV